MALTFRGLDAQGGGEGALPHRRVRQNGSRGQSAYGPLPRAVPLRLGGGAHDPPWLPSVYFMVCPILFVSQ